MPLGRYSDDDTSPPGRVAAFPTRIHPRYNHPSHFRPFCSFPKPACRRRSRIFFLKNRMPAPFVRSLLFFLTDNFLSFPRFRFLFLIYSLQLQTLYKFLRDSLTFPTTHPLSLPSIASYFQLHMTHTHEEAN